MKIPVISIKDIGFGNDHPTREQYAEIGKRLYQTFSTVGFVYVTDHGINPEAIQNVMSSSKKFFNLPTDIKGKYIQHKDFGVQGYVPPDREIFKDTTESTRHEIREALDFFQLVKEPEIFPSEVPELKDALTDLAELSMDLSLRLLRSIALSIGKDIKFFEDNMSHVFDKASVSKIRSLFYPKIEGDVPPGSVRLGEHTDYDIMTLLYQDDIGGLEVKGLDGKWIEATPVKDCILVNTGDMLEIMTSGKFPATAHRVVVPEEEIQRRTTRQSIAFFVQPNLDVMIEPIEGFENTKNLEKYRPISTYGHLLKCYSDNYKY